jgi:starvation-inducible DNA-binding protein
MEELVQRMKVLLSSTFALYLKAHYFHWNVEGPNFPQYHDFLNNFYEAVYGNVDKIAEEIRALDAYAPGSFNRFSALSVISGEERILQPREIFSELLSDNTTYLGLLMDTYNAANAANQIGLSNYLQDLTDQHKKHQWMLRSINKG